MENARRVQKCLIFTDSIPFGTKIKTEILPDHMTYITNWCNQFLGSS